MDTSWKCDKHNTSGPYGCCEQCANEKEITRVQEIRTVARREVINECSCALADARNTLIDAEKKLGLLQWKLVNIVLLEG